MVNFIIHPAFENEFEELSAKIKGLIDFLKDHPQFHKDEKIIKLKKQYKKELNKYSKI